MGDSDEKKKKEPTFKKIKDGMVFISENKIIVGFPTEIETETSAGGKLSLFGGKAGGKRSTRVKYNWQVISGSPLPKEEMKRLRGTISTNSGTAVDTLSNASAVNVMQRCKTCGTPLLIIGKGFKCQKCGAPTT
jgi:hypothetical protein